MAEQALGWLGWTEAEAMASDVNAIMVAMQGRGAMLNAVFGSGGSKDQDTVDPASLPEAGPGMFSRRG